MYVCLRARPNLKIRRQFAKLDCTAVKKIEEVPSTDVCGAQMQVNPKTRSAVLATVGMSVCLSIRQSSVRHAVYSVSKRLKLESRILHWRIAPGLL